MTITKLMQKYIVYVHDSRDAIRLQQFIEANEPTFWFSGYKTNTSVGYYWCNQDDGHLCFTPRYEAFLPERKIVLVKELIAKYNKANEGENSLLNNAIKKVQTPEVFTIADWLRNEVGKVADSEEHPLSQIHISFDGMTTHCIAKNKKGVVARSTAKAIGEDADNYDQLIGTMVAIAKLVPAENRLELFNDVLSVMGIGIQMPLEAKLVYVDEEQ